MRKDYESPKALLFVITMQDILTTSPGEDDLPLDIGDGKSLKPTIGKL